MSTEPSTIDGRDARDLRPDLLENVIVWHRDQNRVVTCFCGREILRSIVPHMKHDHPGVWWEWVQHFVDLRSLGFPLKKIMRLYRAGNGPLLFSWTVIDRAVRSAVESGRTTFSPAPQKAIEHWEPNEFQLSTGTVWDFPRRGDWAVHSGDYRGNWPPQLVRNLIVRFTDPGDIIVDAFVGGGTTLIEAWLCGRKSVGIDISKLALQTTHAKLDEMKTLALTDGRVTLLDELWPAVINGDALGLEKLMKGQGIGLGSVKLICAHPPYLDSLKFTEGDERDLASIRDPAVFYRRIGAFARAAYRVLASNGICAFLIGDVRKGGRFIPLGINCGMRFERQGFTLESVIIKTQHHDRSSEFYRNRGSDSLLLDHEYLFILRKPGP